MSMTVRGKTAHHMAFVTAVNCMTTVINRRFQNVCSFSLKGAIYDCVPCRKTPAKKVSLPKNKAATFIKASFKTCVGLKSPTRTTPKVKAMQSNDM